ncbi:hypothetical protein GGI07_004814 [Coemansia sp. Benny D115]|nr:hypothetical protein GGI07_004814 [Coemansia sp. Benny D115]
MALENAHVCVLGSSALASESLKNLALPGIGSFTVVDDALVGEHDTQTNFFVQADDGGKPRAQCIVDELSELNPDVRGTAVIKAPAALLASDCPADTALVSEASLVIACGLDEAVVRDLALQCWEYSTPLIVATAAGFMACIRTVVPEHAVVESHAELKQDLRLTAPFPALLAFADAIDLSALDSTDLAHVPFVVILIKALQKWAAANDLKLGGDGEVAVAFKRLAEVRDIVRKMAPSSDEENFVEATKAINANCVAYEMPAEVAQILGDPAAAEPSAGSSDAIDLHKSAAAASSSADADAAAPSPDKFWLLARALRRYTESEYAQGKLPLSGAIPDMKADTKSYIALQRVYKQKADEDKAELTRHVHAVLRDSGLAEDLICQSEIDVYCKNARRLRLLRFTPLHTEIKCGPANAGEIAFSEALPLYALFRGCGAFYAKHARYPGALSSSSSASTSPTVAELDDLVEADGRELGEITNGLLSSWGVSSADQPVVVSEALAAEFARSGHDELHNTASMSGGVIAQEAIKLLTHQYVPANNLCIIDGAQAKIHVTMV